MRNPYWQDMHQAHEDVMASVEGHRPDLYRLAWDHYRRFRSPIDYLQSPQWREKALDAKRRAGFRCQLCNGDSSLETHHRTYARFGYERPEDLTVLCHRCHDRNRGNLER